MQQIPYIEPLLKAYDEREKSLNETIETYVRKFVDIEKAGDLIQKENLYLRD